MARTKRSGFKLRSGNSTPFKELGAKPVAPTKPSKPGSSKEELLEIAEGFVRPVSKTKLDYGGRFAAGLDVDLADPSTTSPPGDEPVTRTPAQIMGIEQDEIKVEGASEQSHYQSGGGFGNCLLYTSPSPRDS